MGDKAGAAEGSSIFESLFGGFSNGLSIFTNNPFRRKHEVAEAKGDADSKKDDKDGSEQAKAEHAGRKRVEETVTGVSSRETPTESQIDSKSQRKQKLSNDGKGDTGSEVQGEGEVESDNGRLKKLRREEDIKIEKNRRMDVIDETPGKEVNLGSVGAASGDKKKRKQEISASSGEEPVNIETEETGDVEDKKSKKKKKKLRGGGDRDVDAQTEPVKRQSKRNQKKRSNEETAEGQDGSSLSESKHWRKERKIGSGVQGGGIAEEDSAVKAKRSLDLETGEKQKKKPKLVDVLNEKSPQVSDVGETRSETKASSKRKAEDELERSYEKKLRGSTDSKKDGGVVDMEADSSSKGKRKVVEDDDYLGGKGKKRRLTKQQKIDNEGKLRRTIFVGNIPLDVKAKHLSAEFSQYGAVESTRLRSVPIVDVKMPRKAAVITGKVNENRTSLNGYVVFEEEASAKGALAHNMKEFRGKHLRVDLAGSGSSGIEYDRKRSIFVGNLPFDAEDEDLITLFQGNTPEHEIEAVRIVRDPQTSAGKGFAFVCFRTKLAAEAALDKKSFLMFKNRHLRLERFGYKTVPSTTRETESSGSKPKSGAEQRMSRKKVVTPYEGERAGKRKGVTVKSRERRVGATPSKTGRKASLPKRPAVAAKKARALEMKAGVKHESKVSGGKRNGEGKGKKKEPKGKTRKPSRK